MWTVIRYVDNKTSKKVSKSTQAASSSSSHSQENTFIYLRVSPIFIFLFLSILYISILHPQPHINFIRQFNSIDFHVVFIRLHSFHRIRLPFLISFWFEINCWYFVIRILLYMFFFIFVFHSINLNSRQQSFLFHLTLPTRVVSYSHRILYVGWLISKAYANGYKSLNHTP